CQQYSNWISF
nr:immunoglobulin light chain junction region [Macaca mulatta]